VRQLRHYNDSAVLRRVKNYLCYCYLSFLFLQCLWLRNCCPVNISTWSIAARRSVGAHSMQLLQRL